VTRVDYFLPAGDFDRLLASLPSPGFATGPVPPGDVGVHRLLLTPYRPAADAVRAVLPWGLTIVACGGVVALGAALGLEDRPWGRLLLLVLVGVVFVAGVLATMVTARRRTGQTPPPTRVLEVGAGRLRILERETGAPLASVALRDVTVRRIVEDLPTLSLEIPGYGRLTISAPGLWSDTSWTDAAIDWRVAPLTHHVGSGDWMLLVELLGQRGYLSTP
jgi:hypothetical protein